MLYYVFLAIILLLIIGDICHKRLSYRDITKKLPCVWGLPFGGIGSYMIPFSKTLYVFSSFFTSLKTSTYFTWLGKNPLVITADPDIIKTILTSEDYLNKASMLYAPVDNVITGGIITCEKNKWKHDRKLVNATLTHSILTGYIPMMTRRCDLVVNKFDTLVDGREHKLFEILKDNVFKTAIETTMGTGEHETVDKVIENFNYIFDQTALDITLSIMGLSFLARTPKYFKTQRFLKNYILQLLNYKYEHLSLTPVTTPTFEGDDIKKSRDIFIDQAFNFHRKGLFQESDVIFETLTMIFASYETVTTHTYSVLLMLAMHPEVQEKVYEEITAIYPSKDIDEIEYEDFKQMPYMTMVLDETLRLVPSVPLIGRETTQPTKLTDDIVLPANMQVLISIFSVHRDPKIWGPNAHLFNPDNFLPDNVSQRHPYAYIPFSKGYRSCVGWRYAYIGVRILLIKLLRNFKFTTSYKYENLVLSNEISLRYHIEPSIKMERRPEVI